MASINQTIALATRFARSLEKKEFGCVTIVRAVTQRYPSLARKDVLGIADAMKLNLGTASRQFQEVRSGNIKFDLSSV